MTDGIGLGAYQGKMIPNLRLTKGASRDRSNQNHHLTRGANGKPAMELILVKLQLKEEHTWVKS